jgi:hypothetical protein
MIYSYRNCGDDCDVSIRNTDDGIIITRTDDNSDGDTITITDAHAWYIVQESIEVQGGDIADAIDVMGDVTSDYVKSHPDHLFTPDTFRDIADVTDLLLA